MYIRHCKCIRIDAARPSKKCLKKRSLVVGCQRMRDARLHNSVALHDSPLASAEARLIEGVRHGADQTAGYTMLHPRVRIKRDHVSDTCGNSRWTSCEGDERSVGFAAEKLVQLTQLSPLALPSHPFAFTLVPNAPSMQQQEPLTAIGSRTMYSIEPLDSVNGDGQQFVIVRKRLVLSVQPVGQQREMKLALGIGQVVDLQPLDQLLYDVPGCQQGRHNDKGSQRLGHAVT